MFAGKLSLLDSIFNVDLQTSNFIKSDSNTGVFQRMLRVFKNSFFYRTPPMAAFMSTRKGRRGMRRTKARGKTFQTKEENENI